MNTSLNVQYTTEAFGLFFYLSVHNAVRYNLFEMVLKIRRLIWEPLFFSDLD